MNYEDRVTKEYVEDAIANAGPKFAMGSYVGTGTHGLNNRTSVTFDFVPKMVFVTVKSTITNKFFFWFTGVTSVQARDANSGMACSLTEQTLSWYSNNSAAEQYNSSGTIYNWLAIY